jgi:hypothetical protein
LIQHFASYPFKQDLSLTLAAAWRPSDGEWRVQPRLSMFFGDTKLADLVATVSLDSAWQARQVTDCQISIPRPPADLLAPELGTWDKLTVTVQLEQQPPTASGPVWLADLAITASKVGGLQGLEDIVGDLGLNTKLKFTAPDRLAVNTLHGTLTPTMGPPAAP